VLASVFFPIVVNLLLLGDATPTATTPAAASATEQAPAHPKLHPALWASRQINEWLAEWRTAKYPQVPCVELYISNDLFVQGVLQSIHPDYLPKDHDAAAKFVKSLINSAWTLAFNKIADGKQSGMRDSIQGSSQGSGMTPFVWIDQQAKIWEVEWCHLSCQQLPPLDDFIGDYSFIYSIWAIIDPSYMPVDATDYIINMILSAYSRVKNTKCAPPPQPPDTCTALNHQLMCKILEIKSLQAKMERERKDIDYYKNYYLPFLMEEYEKAEKNSVLRKEIGALIEFTMFDINTLTINLANDEQVLSILLNSMLYKINALTMAGCEILFWLE